MAFSRTITRLGVTVAAAGLVVGTGAAAASAATAAVSPAPHTAVQLKDGRALDAQYSWQWNRITHRWVYQANGKVIVDRYEGRFGDRDGSEHFRLVYGPAGKMAYIQYTGPGALRGYYVQTSDRHAPGVPPTANYGYQGSKLVRSPLEATIFTVSAPGPAGFRTLTVPAVPRVHGAEILTGELFGQLGLNAQKPLLPTTAQLFQQR